MYFRETLFWSQNLNLGMGMTGIVVLLHINIATEPKDTMTALITVIDQTKKIFNCFPQSSEWRREKKISDFLKWRPVSPLFIDHSPPICTGYDNEGCAGKLKLQLKISSLIITRV